MLNLYPSSIGAILITNTNIVLVRHGYDGFPGIVLLLDIDVVGITSL